MVASRQLLKFAALLACCALSNEAAGQSPTKDYFRGKTLRFVIAGSPGATLGANTTTFIAYFAKHIPGNPTILPDFMPGAGGAIAMNYLYKVAPRDGTYIGAPLTGVMIAQVTGDKTVSYDVSKMRWIGRTAADSQILYVWHTTGITDLDQTRRQQITIGSSGASSIQSILPRLMNKVLGTKIKVIEGYSGSAEFNLAVERRETDGALSTWATLQSTHSDWLKSGNARVIVQLNPSRDPELPNVPVASELTQDPDGKALLDFASSTADVGQVFLAPPDVPSPVIDVLRRAFDETMKDPDYIEAAKKADIELRPLSGEEMAKVAQRTLTAPKSVIEQYKEAVGSR